jgi:TRAP-type C4-dicarboxylate transport system permease small subunit
MERLERLVVRLTRAIALVAVCGLLAVAVGTVADVFGRYVLGQPIRGFTDVAALATAVIVAAFFPALLARRGNIALRVGGRILGATGGRILDAFGALLTAVFFALMAWQYARYAAEASQAGERMAVLAWPVGPWWWVVTVLIGITAAVGAIMVALDAAGRRGSED